MKPKCQVIEKQKRNSLEVATVYDANNGLEVLKAHQKPRQLYISFCQELPSEINWLKRMDATKILK